MNQLNKDRGGFTLIELLFVVGIISVLAAISVPNFLEAQTRSKIARVHTDMASVNTGLSRYYIDHGVYPPNYPETTRYLEAAMLHPIIAEGYTTPPADAKIPWYKDQQDFEKDLTSEKMNLPVRDIADQDKIIRTELPPLVINGWQLHALTTPVSYMGTALPTSVFGSSREFRFAYINSYDLFARTENTTATPGLWGDHLTSQTFTALISEGPDTTFDSYHPLSGPWITYDPTNGTVSNGDFYVFEGRRPAFIEPAEDVIPPNTGYDSWGWFP